MHQFLQFIFGRKIYMFRTVPLSIIRNFTPYTQQWYMSYRFGDSSRAISILVKTYSTAVCTVKNSWWWTEELSETCRFSFQKQSGEIGASGWFYYKKGISFNWKSEIRFLSSVVECCIRVTSQWRQYYGDKLLRQQIHQNEEKKRSSFREVGDDL